VEEYAVIFCTVPSQEIGMIIAEDLVSGRYAACVNIVPGITSVYRWKGDVCHDNEFLLVIKSRSSLFTIIRDRITDLHPYEVPEIISCRLSDISDKYQHWLAENTLVQS
jgi:periplasmic divalent cation tolerance protein